MTPRTWTAPVDETRRRTETVPSMWSLMASAVYSGRGLKRTLGADLAVVTGPVGLGHGRRSVLAKIDRASHASG